MKASRMFLSFCLATVLAVTMVNTSFLEDAYADESGSYTTSCSYKSEFGYTYDIDLDLKYNITIDKSVGQPGYVGVVLDLSGSVLMEANTTPDKPAPPMFYRILALYEEGTIAQETDGRGAYGAFHDGLTLLSSPGTMDQVKGGEVNIGSSYDIGFWSVVYGFGSKDFIGSSRSNYLDNLNYTAVNGATSLSCYGTDGRSNTKLSNKFVITVPEEHANGYMNPVGWAITPAASPELGSSGMIKSQPSWAIWGKDVDVSRSASAVGVCNYPLMPETYSYQSDAFSADKKQIELTFNIDDTLLADSSTSLVETTALECAVTYKGDTETQALLTRLGWSDIEYFPGSDSDRFADHCTFWLAHQKRCDGTEVVSVLLKGTDGVREWVSELFNLWNPTSNTAEHFGFRVAMGDVLSEVTDYRTRHDIYDSDFLVRGHSRGAAVGNVLSKELTDIHGIEKVKAILLATPNVYWDKSGDKSYTNILNIEDGGDIVTKLPPGGSKDGIVMGYDSSRSAIKEFYGTDSLWSGSFGAEDIFWTHTPENYLARIMSAAPKTSWNSSSWQLVSIHCATDLEITDESNIIVASIKNNAVSDNNKHLILTNNDCEKTVVLPTDESFEVWVTATDDTTVEYSVYTFSDDGIVENVEPYTVEMVESEVYIAEFGISTDAKLKPVTHTELSGDDTQDSTKPEGKSDYVMWVLTSIALIVLTIVIAMLRKMYVSKRE